jgi:hypothetical protein
MKCQSINNMTLQGRLSCEMIISDKNAGSRRITPVAYYKPISKIFLIGAVQIIEIINQRLLKLPTSTQIPAVLRTVLLPSTGASRYHNCSIYGGISP